MNNIISVEIKGLTASGKSTVAKIIKDQLELAGFPVILDDQEIESSRFSQSLDSVLNKGTVIKIYESNLVRSPANWDSDPVVL